MDVPSASVEDPPSTTMLVPVVTPTVVATTSVFAHNSEATQVNKKEEENIELTPGFIFMCNGKTKPECYLNRVFGLPKGQVELVKKIKPGAKLFLFDFDLKLLYGVYNATSEGELGLEPNAFNGRFPAQVRFNIFKECLPLTEKAFKHAIKDNYQGSKFKQNLTRKQVETLISFFRPITTPTSVTAAPSFSNVVTRHTYPVPVIEERFQLPARPPPTHNSYLPGVRYGNALLPCVSQSEQMITRFPYYRQQSETYVGHGQPPFDPRHIAQQALKTHVGHGQTTLEPRHIIQQASETYLGHGQPPSDPRHIIQQESETYVGHGQPPLDARHIVQQAVFPQFVESYHSMETHQPYLPEKSSLSAQDSYGRYMPAQEVVQMNPVTGYVSEHHLPPTSASQVALQTHAQSDLLSAYQPHYPVSSNENLHQVYADSSQVQDSGNMVYYYSQTLPPASASHVSLHSHEQRDLLSSYQPHYPVLTGQHPHQAFANLPQASVSHFLLQTHAQRDLLSSYQPHYPVTTNNDLHQVYADPHQRP